MRGLFLNEFARLQGKMQGEKEMKLQNKKEVSNKYKCEDEKKKIMYESGREKLEMENENAKEIKKRCVECNKT